MKRWFSITCQIPSTSTISQTMLEELYTDLLTDHDCRRPSRKTLISAKICWRCGLSERRQRAIHVAGEFSSFSSVRFPVSANFERSGASVALVFRAEENVSANRTK